MLPLHEMKRFLTFLWIIAVLGQAFVRTVWTLDYQWNRARYVAQCENLYNVRFDCAGKCYLNKTIEWSESAGQTGKDQLPQHIAQLKDALLYFETGGEWQDVGVAVFSRPLLPTYMVFVPTAPDARIFKPPGSRTC